MDIFAKPEFDGQFWNLNTKMNTKFSSIGIHVIVNWNVGIDLSNLSDKRLRRYQLQVEKRREKRSWGGTCPIGKTVTWSGIPYNVVSPGYIQVWLYTYEAANNWSFCDNIQSSVVASKPIPTFFSHQQNQKTKISNTYNKKS